MRFLRMLLGLVLSILLLGAMASVGLAETYCVRPTQQGNGDGLTWTNAKALSSVISSTSSRGHTYYISGENYGEVNFSAPTNSASLITIKKATVSDHVTDTGWNASWGTTAASFDSWYFTSDYWYLDGQTGGGPGSWDSGHGFTIYNETKNLIVLYLDRTDITIRHTKAYSNRGDTFLNGVKATTGSGNNITVSYCELSQMFGCQFHINNWTNAIIEYSYFYANKSTSTMHSEFVSSIGTNTNLVFRYNLFDSIEGTAVFAGVNSGISNKWQIYGNIFSRSETVIYYYWQDGTANLHEMNNLYFLNNIILNMSGASQGGIVIQKGSNNYIYNNIWYNNIANSFSLYGTHDYNYAYKNIRTEGCSPPCDKNSDITGKEAHGQIGMRDPFSNPNMNPLLADFSASTKAGLNTNSLVPGNNVDMYGRTRGVDGIWDRGPLEFISSNPNFPPLPPLINIK